jgi:hypothetical protein
MRRIMLFALAFVLVAVAAFAQTATVSKNVNLRPTPSTEQTAITLLTPVTSLSLIEPNATGGYYHVRTPDGKEGWVWGKNIRISPTAAAPPPPPPPVTTGCPPTGTHVVKGKAVPYPADSDAGLRNMAKKNIPTGNSAVPLTFADFKALQDDTNQLFGDAHSAKAKIEPNRDALHNLQTTSRAVSEGDLVQLMGFIVADTKQGAESVNCGGSDGFDFHINIAAKPSPSSTAEYAGIVAEMIPQGRAPEWTIPALTAVRKQGLPVLVVGGLTYDNEHFVNDNPKAPRGGQPKRFSLWEVHPITAFFVCEQPKGCDPAMRTQWTTLAKWSKKQ